MRAVVVQADKLPPHHGISPDAAQAASRLLEALTQKLLVLDAVALRRHRP